MLSDSRVGNTPLDPESRRQRVFTATVIVCGVLLALWLARVGLIYSPQRFHLNHENYSYAGRLLEFRQQLAAGYLGPQWCSSFRNGLGSPYFVYYQPGFFYAASLVPWWVPPVRALGIALAAFALIGYFGMLALVRPRFGTAAGWLAASALVLGSYTGTEIYLRGDLSEFAAMMVLPVALQGLLGWLEQGRLRHAAILTLSAASLVLLHPAVALLGYGLLVLGLLLFVIQTRQFRRTASGLLALGLGAGLTAFYWFPVVFEWHLVNSQEAFKDYYRYTKHFVSPLTRLVQPYGRRELSDALTLDILLPLLVAVSAITLIRRRKQLGVEQRRLAVLCLVGIAVFSFLMSGLSAPLWEAMPLLQRMQFPWRALTVVTVLAAAASGSTLLWQSGRRSELVVGMLVLILWLFSWRYTEHKLHPAPAPQTVEQLAGRYFAPDLQNEWVPRGASLRIPSDQRRTPRPGPRCQIDGFVRSAGQLRCHVRNQSPSSLVLPHYYFPGGWQATLDDRPVTLKADARGLMQIDLPEPVHGELVVRFTRTPMRSAGLVVSGLTGLAIVGLGWTAQRIGRSTASPIESPCYRRRQPRQANMPARSTAAGQ